MRRMREMARFICQVRVLRNGFWRTVSSADLVPGDIYEISDPHLSVFPCDALLLTGDAIVNESMLTGESVPVSKLPCTRNEVLHLLSLTTTISPELAKHFLFSGTKIVRVRRGTEKDAGAAVAMVVRTGFNTTKGSLVRSMLFPRPNTFRFYADSFRFIGVMALIACLGFCVSIVNFINLGVCPCHR
jgi:cation-transporting P-type ATPase 13A2